MTYHFYSPLLALAENPDIVLQKQGEYVYQCYCDRSSASGSLPLEEQPIWRIVKIEITTDEAGIERYRRLYPYGNAQHRFAVKDCPTYHYDYKR